MKSPARVFVVWAFAASIVLSAQSRAIPAPDATFGFRPGADFKLATYDQSIEYFRKLAASSKYIRLVETGKTSQGRPMYFALISSPKNLEQVERYRQIAQRLAHPAGLTDAAARELAREGKPFVHIDGGLHSTEVAGAQHTPLLAYDLINRAQMEEVTAKAILDNVILMLWPTINPDGQQMVSEWYMSNVGTPYELSGLPQLYQEYVGHDNNRDAYMLNMIESRVIEQTWRDWEPNIIYVHHQSSPFPTRIWLPPFSEPIGSDAPFLMSREVNMIGMAIAKGLEEKGQVGATHMGIAFDAWYPGYIDYAPNFKNIPAFWTETALFQYATPREYTLADFPENFRDLRPQSLYPSPWRPGWWRLGDAVAYMETASLAVLDYAAKYKETLLYNRYMAGPRSDCARQDRGTVRVFHPADATRSRCRRGNAAPPRLWRHSRLAAHLTGDRRRGDVPRGHVGRADGPGIRRDGEATAQRPELSRHAAVSRRAAIAAVRRGRMDAAAADGRSRRVLDGSSRRRCAGESQAAWAGSRSEAQAGAVQPLRRQGCGAVRQRAWHWLRFESQCRGNRASGRTHHRLRRRSRDRPGAEQRLPRHQPRVEGTISCGASRGVGQRRQPLCHQRAQRVRPRPIWCAISRSLPNA